MKDLNTRAETTPSGEQAGVGLGDRGLGRGSLDTTSEAQETEDR